MEFVDLRSVPFTVADSRFLLRYGDDPGRGRYLGLYLVRYEVPLAQCLVLRLPADRCEVSFGHVRGDGWVVALLGNEARVFFDGSNPVAVVDDSFVRIEPAPGGLAVVAPQFQEPGRRAPEDWGGFLAAADAVMEAWMARVPAVRPHRLPMARQCWWTLGANRLRLEFPGKQWRTAVVPSKLGYVALWQWDAYFIALGLVHGAPELAVEQLDIAFSPEPDGQLPDVVHEGGRLASSLDLPASDLASLRRRGGGREGDIVPLTKPPLGAWAADRVTARLAAADRQQWLSRWRPVLEANQEWWLSPANCDGSGRPQYGHPYSSGLDDSPVFDRPGPVVSPDLLAYLIRQEQLLARWLAAEGGDPGTRLGRVKVLREQLRGLWDESAGMFAARRGDTAVENRTILSLLACFAGDLDRGHLAGLASDVTGPSRFGATWPLPTVALDDPAYSADEMWRGPTWINTNYLVAEGLEFCGEEALAEGLRRRTLDAVERAGGPVEYLNSLTGGRAPTATTSFGWSAALYVDLAVREAAGR